MPVGQHWSFSKHQAWLAVLQLSQAHASELCTSERPRSSAASSLYGLAEVQRFLFRDSLGTRIRWPALVGSPSVHKHSAAAATCQERRQLRYISPNDQFQ